MGHDLDRRRDQAAPDSGGAGGGAPGKRALTDRLVRRAQRKNPEMEHKLKFAPTAFSSAPVDSAAFAEDVAARQAASGLEVDGVVGPATKRAVIGDPFDFLDAGQGGKGAKGGKGGRGGKGAKGAKAPGRTVLGEFTHRDELDTGARLVANLGLEDGVTPATSFHICYADGRAWPDGDLTILGVHTRTTELRSRRKLIVIPRDACVEATFPPEPEPAPEEHGPALHGDGSIGDDDLSRLEA